MLGIAALGQLAFAQLPQTALTVVRKKRDAGGGWHWPRHPSVYSQEYYDSFRPRLELQDEEELARPAIVARTPNLRIPISGLIPGVAMPSLHQLPPYRPVPTLHMNPPPFRMRTAAENAADDEAIIRMLLED